MESLYDNPNHYLSGKKTPQPTQQRHYNTPTTNYLRYNTLPPIFASNPNDKGLGKVKPKHFNVCTSKIDQ